VTGFEARLAAILLAPDPARALRAAARDPALPPPLRRALASADPDGVRMAALLVARLRFERLLRGSPEAAAAFAAEPAAFSGAFRRYHTEVPPTAFLPAAEGALYRRWRAAQPAKPMRRAARRKRSAVSGANRKARRKSSML
jgi:hypothetical protein